MMKRLTITIASVALVLLGCWALPSLFERFTAGNAAVQTLDDAEAFTSPGGGAGKASDEAQGLEIKRQQLAEKEAAFNAKERELNALSARMDQRIKEINAAKAELQKASAEKKKEQDERFTKILKVYNALKPDEAAGLINKLDQKLAIAMLNHMNQRTAVKLIPYLNQPSVLKWTRENLLGR